MANWKKVLDHPTVLMLDKLYGTFEYDDYETDKILDEMKAKGKIKFATMHH